jgi:hypothetical protein
MPARPGRRGALWHASQRGEGDEALAEALVRIGEAEEVVKRAVGKRGRRQRGRAEVE